MSTDTPQPVDPIFAYAGPELPAVAPGWRTSVLFCLPGVLCWVFFIVPVIGGYLFPLVLWGRFAMLLGMTFPLFTLMELLMLPLAVITAIWSLFYFYRRPKRWHVILCLTANVIGLGWTAFVLFAIAYLS